MDVIKFLRGLGPSGIERKDFVAEIQVLISELNDNVIPAYYSAETRAKLLKWEDPFCRRVETDVINGLSKSIRSERNFASIVHANLELLSGLLQHVGGEVEKRMATVALGDELPLEVVSLLTIVNDATYVSRFSLDLLNVMLSVEAEKRGAVDGVEQQPPVLVARIKAKYQSYIRTLNTLAITPKEYDNKLRQVENLRFNKKTWAVLQYDRGVTAGLVTTPASGFYWSPIFVARKIVADWQNTRYENAVAKRTEIEMLIQVLEEKQAKGHDNPQIQRELSYSRTRVAKLDRQIAKVEEELNED